MSLRGVHSGVDQGIGRRITKTLTHAGLAYRKIHSTVRHRNDNQSWEGDREHTGGYGAGPSTY